MTIVPSAALTAVLEQWKRGVDAGNLDLITASFTAEALFQGLDPSHTIGRDGIRAYYAHQRPGLHAEYQVLSERLLAEEKILAYLRVEFSFPDGQTRNVHLSLVVESQDSNTTASRQSPEWLISHYHVSLIG